MLSYFLNPQMTQMIPQDSGRRSRESGEKEGIFSTMKELKGMKIGASRMLRCNILGIKTVSALPMRASSIRTSFAPGNYVAREAYVS
jgi:hypothetical protein